MSEERHATPEEARRVGDAIGVTGSASISSSSAPAWMWNSSMWSRDPQTDVTGNDPIITGTIALAHMKEFPDYYERLERMEDEANRDWAEGGPGS